MADLKFKPKDPKQDKRSAAFALCTWLDQQGHLKDSDVDKKTYVCKCPKCGHMVRSDKSCSGEECPECDGKLKPQTTLPLAGEDVPVVYSEKGEIMNEMTIEGPFKIVLPITGARRQIVEKAEGGEEIQLFLHVEASGPERDLDGDRFSEVGLVKMVEYASKGDALPFLDGHHRDLLASCLGTIHQPYLTEHKCFAFDVLLNHPTNPFATQLFNDVLAGKRHGASIAGIVHNAEIEEWGENGEFGRIFNDVELIEVSRTSWPSYRASFITLLANKVGKLPQEEFDTIVQRRERVVNLMNKSEGNMKDMIVRTEDGDEEIWTTNEANELTVKIKSPHGWGKKFSVSNDPWSSVKDRSKPCQFAIIKTGEDGSFSKSKSGYPHHPPGCGAVNRSGVIAAAVRLIQALKSEMPMIDIPPVLSLAEVIGLELYEEKAARFSREELVFAARHILRHYRRDLKMEPPENLVAIAKIVDHDNPEQVAGIIKGLVEVLSWAEKNPLVSGEAQEKIITEVNEMPEDKIIQEDAPAAEENLEETPEGQVEETVTEPVVEAETVVEETSEAKVEEQEVAGETQENVVLSLADSVTASMAPHTFSALIYEMQSRVGRAVNESDLDKAQGVVNDFALMACEMIADMVKSGVRGVTFLKSFEERIELAEGRFTKSRVAYTQTCFKATIEALLNAGKVMENAEVADDGVIEHVDAAVQKVQTEKSEFVLAMEAKVSEIEAKRKQEMSDLAEVLSEPEREPVTRSKGNEEIEETVALSEDEKRTYATKRFLASVK